MVSTVQQVSGEVETVSFATLPISSTTRTALDAMGIVEPTPIQAQALPALLSGRDIIGQARTGSGKTLAFAIPAVELTDPRVRLVQALILCPTRELAVQVNSVIEALAAPRGLKTALIYGGRAFGPQRDALKQGAQIVVGTPGRVDDLFSQGALRLDGVRFLVLDEADEMLDRGFGPQVEKIIARTSNSRQTALFSATLPEWVHKTASKHLDNPVHVVIDPRPDENVTIEHVAIDVPEGRKLDALCALLDARGDGQIIVFGRTKHGVKKLAKQLEMAGYPVAALQGNLSQNARDAVMAEFRAGNVQILLATNVAARGLDVSTVELVINYELPESAELLTHRVGRTGRMGREGMAITLLGPEDAAKWRQIERGLSVKIERKRWAGSLGASQTVTSAPQPQRRERTAPVRQEAPAQAREPRTPNTDRAVAGKRPSWPALPETSFSLRSETGRAKRPRQEARPASEPVITIARPADSRRRANESASESTRTDRAPRARIDVECSACGEPATVNFQPDPTRPVYCGPCFRAMKGEPVGSARR